jgi:hypothetical protein
MIGNDETRLAPAFRARARSGAGLISIITLFLVAFTNIGMNCLCADNAQNASTNIIIELPPPPETKQAKPPEPARPKPPPKPAEPVFPQPGHEWVNSLGQRFVAVPGTGVLFATTDTRVQDYQSFVDSTHRPWILPAFPQSGNHPAVNVSWDDATTFCAWLTAKERAAGRLKDDQLYRLPTDAEWSVAVGLDAETGSAPADKDGRIEGIFPWGSQWPPPVGAGNLGRALNADDYDFTSPVGSFKPNRNGLFDMAGNVRQWCRDTYLGNDRIRVLRGSSWTTIFKESLLSSSRTDAPRDQISEFNGFRCVLAP